jgi:hypothetical protein
MSLVVASHLPFSAQRFRHARHSGARHPRQRVRGSTALLHPGAATRRAFRARRHAFAGVIAGRMTLVMRRRRPCNTTGLDSTPRRQELSNNEKRTEE